MLAREALSDERVVAKINAEFVAILVDLDEEKAWAKKHHVSSIPVIHWADSTGEVMSTTDDVQPAERVLEDIETCLEFATMDEDE